MSGEIMARFKMSWEVDDNTTLPKISATESIRMSCPCLTRYSGLRVGTRADRRSPMGCKITFSSRFRKQPLDLNFTPFFACTIELVLLPTWQCHRLNEG